MIPFFSSSFFFLLFFGAFLLQEERNFMSIHLAADAAPTDLHRVSVSIEERREKRYPSHAEGCYFMSE